jgi:manganese oxidase
MKKMRSLTIITILALLLSLTSFAAATAQPVQAAGATIIYNIYATDAIVSMADGTPLYIYGYIGGRQGQPLTYMKSLNNGGGVATIPTGAPAPTGGPITPQEAALAGNAQFPGPIIYARVGDVVEIRFKNLGVTAVNAPLAPNDPHSIHLHGLDVDAANDGVPETSIGAIPANSGDPGSGNVIVYMFAPKVPGTYMYHCHQEADIHVTMGMYGALVVYNPSDPAAVTGPGSGKGGTLWGWKYDKDYVMLLSDTDVNQHSDEQTGAGLYNPVNFVPQFFFINGISFPNTIHADGGSGFVWSDWIASHPGYDPLIAGSVSTPASAMYRGQKGDKVLVRMINMGFQAAPMHMHGYHAKILGSDQRPWAWANLPGYTPTGSGLEKNTVLIGSGETYELLFDFGQQALTSTYAPAAAGVPTSTFAGGTQTRFNTTTLYPVSNALTSFPAIPLMGDVVTYVPGPTVKGAVGIPLNSQLFPFHNHDDYKATNNGAYPGGMFTMIMPLP